MGRGQGLTPLLTLTTRSEVFCFGDIDLSNFRQEGMRQADLDTPGVDHTGTPGYGCHYIAPSVASAIGGFHESGIYLFENGEYADHHWVIKDGYIIDATYKIITPLGSPQSMAYVPYGDLEADPEEEPEAFKDWLLTRD